MLLSLFLCSIALLIVTNAGLITLSPFYIWLPALVALVILIIRIILVLLAVFFLQSGKIKRVQIKGLFK